MSEKTLVIGASTNPARYAHKAVLALLKKGHHVIPLGIKKGKGPSLNKTAIMFDNQHTLI